MANTNFLIFQKQEFDSCIQIRNNLNESERIEIIQELIDSLVSLKFDWAKISNFVAMRPYIDSYGDYSIGNILSKVDLLINYFTKCKEHRSDLEWQNICTGYISLKASNLFESFWFFPSFHIPQEVAFSKKYVTFLKTNSSLFKRSKIFEDCFEQNKLIDTDTYYDLLGESYDEGNGIYYFKFDDELAKEMLKELQLLETPAELIPCREIFSKMLFTFVNDTDNYYLFLRED